MKILRSHSVCSDISIKIHHFLSICEVQREALSRASQ
jgi:hypothetical protein